jgi:hypothetical protein
MEARVHAALHQHERQAADQSFGASNANSLPLNNMLRIVTVVQQFMTIQRFCVRGRENSGHYKNSLKSHEAK